ncbi:hypothetical protein BDP67DRAFT_529245 [Colletotrichum lupini]|nr:hypothetical protein BDP67DRAFT_529245 [Colletotrichum lupini]
MLPGGEHLDHERLGHKMAVELVPISFNLASFPYCAGMDGLDNPKWIIAEPLNHGPKRKQAYVWSCCRCQQSGNPLRLESCQNCGNSRCAYCPVLKVRN